MKLTRVYLHQIDLPQLRTIACNGPQDPAVLAGKIKEVELELAQNGKFRIRRGLPHVIELARQGFDDVWAILQE
jgi:hypothetical protein